MPNPYRIAVIGDAMVDYRRYSFTSRQSPEDPDCCVLSNLTTEIELGGAANVARWLAKQQDVEVTLYSHWAYDATGKDLVDLCDRHDIFLSGCCLRHREQSNTTRKERICLKSDQEACFTQIVRCDEDTNSELNTEERQRLQELFLKQSFDLVVVADYDKGMFQGREGQRLIRWISTLYPGLRVVVNSKVPQRWEDACLEAFICNHKEADVHWQEVVENDRWPLFRSRCRVVTQGSGGVYCNLSMEPESTVRRMLHEPTLADNVIDVTGAGDAFTAGFAYSVLRRPQLAGHAGSKEQEVKQWIHEGQRWAAHCCAQIGCGTPLQAAGLAVPDPITEGSTDAVTV
jgi:bifunctional ADP-heptose synthase (sugar kinase/adenylyltransferase)